MPRVRGVDTAAGAGLGALGGLGIYGLRNMLREDDPDTEEDDPSLLNHLLGGAGIGAIGGNFAGDRLRRHISNTVTPVEYGGRSPVQEMMPRSVSDLYKTMILDQPRGLPNPDAQVGTAAIMGPKTQEHYMSGADPTAAQALAGGRGWKSFQVSPFVLDARRELFRRGMGLPIRGEETGDTIFRSIGDREYKPTATSGGLPGTYEHVEYNPKALLKRHEIEKQMPSARGANKDWTGMDMARERDRIARTAPYLLADPVLKQRADKTLEQITASAKDIKGWEARKKHISKQVAALKHTDDRLWDAVRSKQFSQRDPNPSQTMHARHGTDAVGPDRLVTHDLWDFGLTPVEDKMVSQYMSEMMQNPKSMQEPLLPYLEETQPEQMAIRNSSDPRLKQTSQLDLFAKYNEPSVTKMDHLKNMLMRKVLNELVMHRGGVAFRQKWRLPENSAFHQWRTGGAVPVFEGQEQFPADTLHFPPRNPIQDPLTR